MTQLEELKKVILETWRDEEMASSACYGLEAYSRLWPAVLVVNDWDVWNESRRDLKPEVLAWLRQQGTAWDFYHLLGSWGLLGFKDQKTAEHFKLRWSGVIRAVPSSSPAWNPHPINCTFLPDQPSQVPSRARGSRRAVR